MDVDPPFVFPTFLVRYLGGLRLSGISTNSGFKGPPHIMSQ